MCIYCNTTNYRKIYETHVGNIPKDEDGRTFDIHHIDGDRTNNAIDNLVALSIQDHYNIHYSQGDWMASWKIGIKMKISPEELSRLASNAARKRVEDETHNFLGGILTRKRVENGTHNLLDKEAAKARAKKRVEDGTHNFLGGELQSNVQRRRLDDGTHNFLGGELQQKRLANGTHNFTQQWQCEHCGKIGKNTSNYIRWHGSNCKLKQ